MSQIVRRRNILDRYCAWASNNTIAYHMLTSIKVIFGLLGIPFGVLFHVEGYIGVGTCSAIVLASGLLIVYAIALFEYVCKRF